MQHITLKLGRLLQVHRVGSAVMRQCAEHPADGVADFLVGFDEILEDFRADAQIVRVIRGADPQAQDVGARVLDDGLRCDHVADGFRHFLSFFIKDKTMRQHRVIRRMAARAAAFEK